MKIFLHTKMYMTIRDIHLNCAFVYMSFIIILFVLIRISRRNFTYICYSTFFFSISLNCLICSICPRRKKNNIFSIIKRFLSFFLMIYCEFLSYGNYIKIELITFSFGSFIKYLTSSIVY